MDTLITRYAEYLQKGRQDLVNCVKDITHDELHHRHNGTLNSIAMLLKHSEQAERFLIHKLIADDPIPDRKTPPFEPGDEKLDELLAALENSQKHTMEILENLTDEQLLEEKEIKLSSGMQKVNNEWGILHTLEHEASHKGQILILKKLARA